MTKCAWCGKTLALTKNSRRPKQHFNGPKTCPGSGQPVGVHSQLRRAAEESKK